MKNNKNIHCNICQKYNLETNKCICKGIKIISMLCKTYIDKLNNLKSITYNKTSINYKSIDAFQISDRQSNDKNNKIRENIIGAIINNKIPKEYFIISNRWKKLKEGILNVLITLNYKKIKHSECEHKGGRKFNFDFEITIYYEDRSIKKYNIELKFNISELAEAPQFVSPMNPSQYLDKSFEEYYYEKYLPNIAKCADLPMPEKEDYLKQIHGNKPKCMKKYQEKYYQGCKSSSKFTNNENDIDFYNLCKAVSNKSISQFIKNSELNLEKLSEYLQNTQKNKIYMMYCNNEFKIQYVNLENYQIKNVVNNPDKFRYECETKSGIEITVLLRWKNGNGIAFPAFQIS